MLIKLQYTVFALAVIGCVSENKSPETEEISTFEQRNTSTQIQTVVLKKEPFIYFLEGSGEIKATQQVDIHFQSAGSVTDLFIHNGQWVNSGKLLARLYDKGYHLVLRKVQAELEEKKVEYESQLIGFESAFGDSSYATIQENLSYSSGLASAQLAVEEAKMNLEKARILSPIEGIVANLSVEEKQLVEANQMLCTIYAPNSLVLNMQVLEGSFSQVAIGQTAKVRLVAVPTKQFSAKVVEINPIVDKNSMIQVKLRLLETKGLLPGMKATAILQVPIDSSLNVPKSAVVVRSGKEVVFTVERGQAKWHYVTTGLDNGEVVQIIEGLKSDEQVIVDNNLQLAHDAPVQVVPIISSN